MQPPEELRYHLKEAYHALKGAHARLRFPKPQRFEPGPQPGGPADGHFHLRPELFLQRQATTRFCFPSETLDLGPDEALVVPPRVYHSETVVEGDSPFLNLVLYADGAALSCHQADCGPAGRPRVAYPEYLEGSVCVQLGAWLEEACRLRIETAGSEGVVLDLLRSVVGLTLLLLDQSAAKPDKEPLVVVRCRRMIHEDLGNPDLSVSSLARALGCNADYLSHLFRSVRGERLMQYIDELRMQRAAELLVRTGLSCKEVAWASGYASQSYFIRSFRGRWGSSPQAYRLRLLDAAFGAAEEPSRAEPGGALSSPGRSP